MEDSTSRKSCAQILSLVREECQPQIEFQDGENFKNRTNFWKQRATCDMEELVEQYLFDQPHFSRSQKDRPLKLIFDASKVTNNHEMHDLIQETFCPYFYGYGRNLDAFVDVCRGGFGLFEYMENIWVVYTPPELWKGDQHFIAEIKKILEEVENIDVLDTTTFYSG